MAIENIVMENTGAGSASETPVQVLLVEDNEADVRLTVEAFKETTVMSRLRAVEDGVEALAYLRRQGKYSDAARPDLVLLDLNLPRMDGAELLAIIKRDPYLKQIPVVVFTTSSSARDIAKSYALHANCYITKPVDLNRFLDIVKSIEAFWFTVVALPTLPDRFFSASS